VDVVVVPQEGFVGSSASDKEKDERAKEVLLMIGWLGLQVYLGIVGRDSPGAGHY
jgi:hypothetical protein